MIMSGKVDLKMMLKTVTGLFHVIMDIKAIPTVPAIIVAQVKRYADATVLRQLNRKGRMNVLTAAKKTGIQKKRLSDGG